MYTASQLNKKVTLSVMTAVENFIKNNNLDDSTLDFTPMDTTSKVMIRFYKGDVNSLREMEKTIYHGVAYDVYTFRCITGKSGVLEYDDVLTDEYYCKCREI